MKYIASCSGGKDSCCMTDMLIELGYKLDEVVFFNNGMEFKAIYNIMEKLKQKCLEHNIKYVELKPKCPFLYQMFDKPVKARNGTCHCGYSWCGGQCRWGTTEKLQAIDKYCEEQKAMCYVGIASDEPKRLAKERKYYKLFPLADWHMTEKDCLNYCYSKGYNWIEKTNSIFNVPEYIDLYKILKRVSCWCCRNKNLVELKNYYIYFTNSYWLGLKEFQLKTDRPFYKGKTKRYQNGRTIFDLEEQFKKEVDNET